MPDDFDIITQDQLDEVRKYHIDRKRWFLGDKKQFLNLENLADIAETLRKEYSKGKSRYKEFKDAFFLLNKTASVDEWKEKWSELQFENFPNLNHQALNSIEEFRPFELARIHLADLYNYDEETIRKKLTESKQLKTGKRKR